MKIPVDIMNWRCVFYNSFKWIPGKVTSVWVDNKKYSTGESIVVKDETKKEIKGIQKLGRKGETTQFVGTKRFYKAGKSFYNLQCNVYADMRVQQGNKLIVYDNEKNKVELEVAFTVSRTTINTPYIVSQAYDSNDREMRNYVNEKVIIQNEDIFNMEKSELIQKNISDDNKILEIGEKTIDEGSLFIAKKWLSQFLRESTNNNDYNLESPYINIAVDSIKDKKTNKELYRTIAELIVYTKIKEAQIFLKRLKAEYYLPEILHQLTHEEKFPEIYDPIFGASDKSIEIYTSFIQSNIQKIINKMLTDSIVRDQTKRKMLTEVDMISYPAAPTYEDEKFCTNKDKIDPRNIVYYRDNDDGKVFCFDVIKLASSFERGDYINPYTGKVFSQEFIRRYTITYYDKENGKNYTFPFESLYNRFKAGDIVNPQTGRNFDISFVDVVSKGSTFHKSAYLRDLSFKRLDRRVATCVNPEDVAFEPVESVLFYEDKKNNKRYCFSISNLSKILKDSSINPISGEAFSEEFIENFKKTYSDDLSRGGINQIMFRNKYGEKLFKNIPLPISKEVEEKYEIKIEQQKTKPLIIPELWDLVSQSVKFYENKMEKEAKFAFLDPEEETSSESTISEKESTKSSETKSSEKESTKSSETKSEKEEKSSETKSEKEEKSSETKSEKEDKEEKSSETKSEKEQKIKAKKCSKCKKPIGDNFYRTMGIKNNKPFTLVFCCFECMESADIIIEYN